MLFLFLVESASISMSMTFEKDLDSHILQHQHACNVLNETHMALQRLTEELKSQIQQLKDTLYQLNQVKRVTWLQIF